MLWEAGVYLVSGLAEGTENLDKRLGSERWRPPRPVTADRPALYCNRVLQTEAGGCGFSTRHHPEWHSHPGWPHLPALPAIQH